MRKTRIFSWRIGIFRLFIEKHEWVDRSTMVPTLFANEVKRIQNNRINFNNQLLKPTALIKKNIKNGYKKGRK